MRFNYRSYTKSDWPSLVAECASYIQQCEEDSKEQYLKELSKIKSWNDFINSGVFHDAVGKLVEVTKLGIKVCDEY